VTTLHITNGDCAADTLRQVVDAPVVITADVLYEGPAPRVEGDAWYEVRARCLASNGYTSYEKALAGLAATDRAIADACRDDSGEIVLWFEHDLFDQLLLIRTLALLSRAVPKGPGAHDAARVSLICIDKFPGVDRFIGLGQLTAGQLATLVDTRRPVTAEHYRLAEAAWEAFRSPDPRDLLPLAVRRDGTNLGHPALPFLGAALRRFLAEFPSVANGLSQTEALALLGLRSGATPAGELFAAAQTLEPCPFLGDWSFYTTLRRLATARVPLVTVEAGPDARDLRTRLVAVTEAGRDVLAGRRDRIALNGIDVWRGGVHLEGRPQSSWRWDEQRETLVS
jgi:hypothetical protein